MFGKSRVESIWFTLLRAVAATGFAVTLSLIAGGATAIAGRYSVKPLLAATAPLAAASAALRATSCATAAAYGSPTVR